MPNKSPFRRLLPPLDARVGLEGDNLKRRIPAPYASNFSPLVQAVGGMPIEFDVMRSIELAIFPVPTFAINRKFASPQTKPLGVFSFPTSSVERLRWEDTGAPCISIAPAALTVAPLTFEIARTQFNKNGTGVLESIATFFQIEALDANQVPIFQFSTFPPDANPCPLPLVHPDPLVTNPFRMVFRLIAQNIPTKYIDNANVPTLVGANPNFVPLGTTVISPWADMRYGWGTRYSRRQQFVIGNRVLLRLFVDVSADPNRWNVQKMVGRLAGYWHKGGQQGAALRSATEFVV